MEHERVVGIGSRARRRSGRSGRAKGALLLAAASLIAAACGSSSKTATTTAAATTAAATTAAATTAAGATTAAPTTAAAATTAAAGGGVLSLDALYKGVFSPPPSSGPPAQKGKNVWFLSCGQIFLACSMQSTAFQEAGKALGWNVTVFDTKADVTEEANGIRQAIAAHADAITALGQDCAPVQAAWLEAKKAGIKIVGDYSVDCNDPKIAGGSGPQIYDAFTLATPYPTWTAFQTAWQAARAAYVIGKTGGKANVIQLLNEEKVSESYDNDGFSAALTAQCPGCKIVAKTVYTFAHVDELQQVVSSALLQHPEANVLSVHLDAIFSLGVTQALQAAGRKDLIVMGSEGLPPNFDLIRQGVQTASMALPYPWLSWATADVINRLLSGAKGSEIPTEGLGFQAIDKDHNLPGSGVIFEGPVDYKAAYTKVWSGS